MKFVTDDWSDVKAHYLSLEKYGVMVSLVNHIVERGYDKGLFPVTSMMQLRIGRHSDYEKGDAELTIDFNPKESNVTFTYIESEFAKNPWTRECSEGELIEVSIPRGPLGINASPESINPG